MTAFSQKWTLVSFLEPVTLGFSYHWKEWPLHVTLMNTFAVDWTDRLQTELSAVLRNHKASTIAATSSVVWGTNDVILLEQSDAIMNLHDDIYELLIAHDALFNEPQYVGDGYLPHSTVQTHAGLQPGDMVQIRSVALVDMFPEADPYQRLVSSIIAL